MKTLLLFGGLLHFALLLASALVPKTLDWKKSLASLHPFLRQLFWTYGVFIVLIMISFGTIILGNADALVAGGRLARSFCALVAVFWGARLFVQLFVFDCRDFLTNAWLRTGYRLLTLVFVYLTIVFATAALGGAFHER